MLTIAPRSPVSVSSLRLIAVAASRMQLKVPIRLIASTFLYASRLCAESNSPSLPMVRWAQPTPAEFTNARSGPRSVAVLTASMIWSVSVTSTDEHAADLVGQCLTLVRLQVGDDHAGAPVGQLAGRGRADS